MNLIQRLVCTGLVVFATHGSVIWAADRPSDLVPAYYVAEFEITDPGGMKPYSANVESTFKPYGGRFIVRGGVITSLEGNRPERRRVVIQFESREKAMAWYNSPDYVALRKIRQQSAKTDVYLIDGAAPP